MNHTARLLLIAGLMGLVACDQTEKPEAPVPAVTYTPVAFSEVPGWEADNMAKALPAWRRSCNRILGFTPSRVLGPEAGTAGDWQETCRQIAALPDGDSAGLRDFLEVNFVALHVTSPDDPPGLFTGYFEPILEAARTRSDQFSEPIYALPEDRVTVNLGAFDPALKGKSVVGRVEDRTLVPYRERGEIDAGAITDKARTLFWARDPLDVFILQVQGSGIVSLPDGAQQRIGFAGHNGHGYGSLGRWLIDQGEVQPNRATWEDIRAWLEANPDRARSALAVNPRYIFFRELDGEGPLGAAGVPLTPERSMAVDTDYVPLNVPVWLDIGHLDGQTRLQRLMLAQDVGSAIKGVVRGDFYWGTGRAALDKAGRMKSKGQYFMLVPKTLQPTS